MRRVLIDIEPLLRFPQYRLLWFGYLVSHLGTQLTRVAIMYQVFTLTGSSLLVGMVSLVQLLPAVVGAIGGGAIADAMARRSLLLISQPAMAATAFGLAANSLSSHPRVVIVFVLAATSAAVNGVDGPTRTSLMTELVDPPWIPKATALRKLLSQSTAVVGPAIAGLLLAAIDTSGVYLVDTASFGASIGAVLLLERRIGPANPGRPSLVRSIVEGLRFLRTKPAIQGSIAADLNAMIFGMPTALFPALGIERFHGGAQAVGYLNAAPGAGALVATLCAGWIPTIARVGRAVLIASAVWGFAITLFGLTPWLPMALALLAAAGAADVISSVLRATIVQVEAPNQLRGRISAIHSAVVQSGPRLGNAEAGVVAAIAGNTFSVVSGGLVCVFGSLIIARLMPQFGRYVLPIRGEAESPAVSA